MKFCIKCSQYKEELEFNKCDKNHDKYLDYDRQRTHTEERIKYKQQYDKQYYENNKEKSLIYHRERYKAHKEYWKLTEEQKQRRKEYYKQNKDKINRQKRISRANNPIRRLNESFSSNLNYSLKYNKNNIHWETLVNYSLLELKQHLESQFDNKMSWNNYGEYWEIDYIIPINTFNFNSYKDREFQVCWSLANLRPLEKIANRKRPKDGSDIPNNIQDKIRKGNNYGKS